MTDRSGPRAHGGDRHWAHGVGLTLAGLLAASLIIGGQLRTSLRDLDCMRAAYATKLELAERKGVVEQRAREQEAALAAAEQKLLTGADVAALTQTIAVAARATGCSIASIQPLNPRVLPRADPNAAKAGGDEAKSAAQMQFVEWSVRVSVRGEYGQIGALLARLNAETRYLNITTLTIEPNGEDRESLACELEIAGYGLRLLTEGG